MIRGKNLQPTRHARFSSCARTASLLAALVGLVFWASSCTSPETSRERPGANPTNASASRSPTVSVKVNPPNGTTAPPAATNPNAPASASALEPIAENVLQREVKLLDGGAFKLADYKGKVVVVDLWATWCGPCRMTIPHLIELRNSYDPKEVEIIGLTTEDPDADAQKVRNFVRDFKINYKIGWVEDDMAWTLMRGRNSIPQAFIITKDGRLLKHFIGYSEAIPPMMRQAIDQAKNMPG